MLNQGIVWDPVTGAGDRYTKHHPVVVRRVHPVPHATSTASRSAGSPWSAATWSRAPGWSRSAIAGVEVADSICFDVAYDDAIYAQVSRGAQLLTVQTSNATFIHTDQIDQQFAITRLRAIETGRWLAVASTNGVSGVIAPDGSGRRQRRPAHPGGAGRDRRPRHRDHAGGPDRAVVGPGVHRARRVLGLLLALVPYRRNRTRQQAEDATVPSGLVDANESRSE